jgi:hypothetical protein
VLRSSLCTDSFTSLAAPFAVKEIIFCIAVRFFDEGSRAFRARDLSLCCFLLLVEGKGEGEGVEESRVAIVGRGCCPVRVATPWRFGAVPAMLLSGENLKTP